MKNHSTFSNPKKDQEKVKKFKEEFKALRVTTDKAIDGIYNNSKQEGTPPRNYAEEAEEKGNYFLCTLQSLLGQCETKLEVREIEKLFKEAINSSLKRSIWAKLKYMFKKLFSSNSKMQDRIILRSKKETCWFLGNHDITLNPKNILALVSGDSSLVRIFESLALEVNAKDINGNTPLMIAAEFPTSDIEYLIRKGADPNQKNNEGENALFCALSYHDPKSNRNMMPQIKILLAAGTDLRQKNKKGEDVDTIIQNNSKLDENQKKELIELIEDQKIINKFLEKNKTDTTKKSFENRINAIVNSLDDPKNIGKMRRLKHPAQSIDALFLTAGKELSSKGISKKDLHSVI